MLNPKFDEPLFYIHLAAYRAATSEEDKRAALDACIRTAEPLIEIAMVGIHSADFDALDEIKQAGRRGFLRALERPPSGELRPGYLIRKARWTMLDWLRSKAARSEAFGFGYLGYRPEDFLGRFEGFREVENRIYLDQMRQVALDRFVEECRFDRAEYQVCVRIAEAIVNEEQISKRLLEKDHGDVEVDFFYDYVRVVLRNFLRDVWLEHRENPSAEWLVDLFEEWRVSLIR